MINKIKFSFFINTLIFINIQTANNITWTPGEVIIGNCAINENTRQIHARSKHATLNSALKGPQLSGTNVLGTDSSLTPFAKPDTMGAIGPQQFLMAINQLIRTFNKLTGILITY